MVNLRLGETLKLKTPGGFTTEKIETPRTVPGLHDGQRAPTKTPFENIDQDCHKNYPYLIFVICFTQARFLENKIYTEERVNYDKQILRQNSVNCDVLAQASYKDEDHEKKGG